MAQRESMDRRSFVKVAGAMLPGAALIGTLAAGASQAAAQDGAKGAAQEPKPEPTKPNWADKPLRVGLIGCGGRGTGAALQALRADAGAVLVAMGDVFEDRVKAAHAGLIEELGEEAATKVRVEEDKKFVGFDSYQKVIDSGVDVVLLCGYPAFRPMHRAAAVAAGKHVFVEKPLAVDGPGIRSVIESARKAKEKNLAMLVGFCWRHNPGMRGAFAQVHGGAIGDVVSVHTNYHTSTLSKRPRQAGWSEMEFQMRNWWHFAWISGDHIVEQSVHSVDRLAWAMNDVMPLRVTCLGGRAARTGEESGNVFDHFAAVYEHEDGRRAYHTARQIDGCPSDNSDYIHGTTGSCTVNGWKPVYEIRERSRRGLGEVTWKGAGTPEEASAMYQLEHDALFRSIRMGDPINDGERSANSCLMAIMARQAAYTGQTVTWEMAMNSQESLVPATLSMGEAPAVQVAVPGKTKFA